MAKAKRKTGDKPSDIEKEILKVTGAEKREAKEEFQTYAERLATAIDSDDAFWDALSESAQHWFSEAVKAMKAKEPIPEFEAAAEAEPEGEGDGEDETESAAAEDEAGEEEQEAKVKEKQMSKSKKGKTAKTPKAPKAKAPPKAKVEKAPKAPKVAKAPKAPKANGDASPTAKARDFIAAHLDAKRDAVLAKVDSWGLSERHALYTYHMVHSVVDSLERAGHKLRK